MSRNWIAVGANPPVYELTNPRKWVWVTCADDAVAYAETVTVTLCQHLELLVFYLRYLVDADVCILTATEAVFEVLNGRAEVVELQLSSSCKRPCLVILRLIV